MHLVNNHFWNIAKVSGTVLVSETKKGARFVLSPQHLSVHWRQTVLQTIHEKEKECVEDYKAWRGIRGRKCLNLPERELSKRLQRGHGTLVVSSKLSQFGRLEGVNYRQQSGKSNPQNAK